MVPLTLHRHRAPLWLCLTAASVLGLVLVQPRAALALEHSLEILGEPIVIQADPKTQGSLVTTITVRNNGPQVNDLTVRAVTSDGQVIQVENKGGQTIQPYSVAQFELVFPGAIPEELSGTLIIEASDVIPGVQSLTLQPAPPARSFLGISELDAGHIIALGFRVGLGVFVLATLAVALKLITHPDPNKKMTSWEVLSARLNGLKWSFEENWASTFVLLSGVLGSFMGEGLMPKQPQILSTEGFQALNALFPMMVLVAPFVLAALNGLGREPRVKENGGDVPVGELILDQNGKIPVLIIPFIAASAIVVWAVIGELGALAVLFMELEIAGHITPSVARAAHTGLLILSALGVFYAGERVYQTSLTATKRADLKPIPPKKEREAVGRAVYLP